jgi:hypothetical protein
LTLADWPERVKGAGLTSIGIHHQNYHGGGLHEFEETLRRARRILARSYGE